MTTTKRATFNPPCSTCDHFIPDLKITTIPAFRNHPKVTLQRGNCNHEWARSGLWRTSAIYCGCLEHSERKKHAKTRKQ